MKEIRIILMMLAGLLMTACTTGEDGDYSDSYLNNPTEKQENGDPSPSDSELVDTIVFEGIWSIDGTPLEQHYSIVCILDYQRNRESVKFLTFPYQAVAEHVLTDTQIADIVEPDRLVELLINYVGKSAEYSYYDAVTESAANYSWPLSSYAVRTEDEGTIVLTLGLKYNESVLSFSKTSANCILVVPTVELYYDDDRHRTLELNPAMKLSFVSTKRL